MACRLEDKPVESTLYIPSSYDYDTGDEDDWVADQREERSPSERGERRHARFSRFALQRCLAWSQEEDDDQEQVEDRETGEDLVEELVERLSGSAMTRDYSESSISMVKSFGSFHSAVVDAASSSDFQTASASNKGIRPIHWEEQVTVDKNLNSFLSSKRQTASGKYSQ
ncbi:MAG: hypothetical protein SGILL_000432 [Bacillariaceae sp.]